MSQIKKFIIYQFQPTSSQKYEPTHAFDTNLMFPTLKNEIYALNFNFEDKPLSKEAVLSFFSNKQDFDVIKLNSDIHFIIQDVTDFTSDDGHNYFKFREKLPKNIIPQPKNTEKVKEIARLAVVSLINDDFYENVSVFLRGSKALKADNYKKMDSINYLLDGKGMVISSQITISNNRIKNYLFLLCIANAYRLKLHYFHEEIHKIISNQSFQKNNQLEDKLYDFTYFLNKNYSTLPILPQHNETFFLYEEIKERWKISELYHESLSKLSLLTELVRIKMNSESNKQFNRWALAISVISMIAALIGLFK